MSCATHEGARPHIQQQSRWWCLYHHILDSSMQTSPLRHCVLTTQGIGTHGSSMGYSVTKAAGLHLVKCLAATQGPKIRVNAILPGLLLTDWVRLRRERFHTTDTRQGLRYGDQAIDALKKKALLKQEVRLHHSGMVTILTPPDSVRRLCRGFHHHG